MPSLALGPPLQQIMEIKSSGKVLQAVLKILNEQRTTMSPTGCAPDKGQMRYIAGYDVTKPNDVWPKQGASRARTDASGACRRQSSNHAPESCHVDEFNQTQDVAESNSKPLDVAERGENACDTTKSVGPNSSVNTYPGDQALKIRQTASTGRVLQTYIFMVPR